MREMRFPILNCCLKVVYWIAWNPQIGSNAKNANPNQLLNTATKVPNNKYQIKTLPKEAAKNTDNPALKLLRDNSA